MSSAGRSLSFRLFDALSRSLSPEWRQRLGSSRLLAPVRNALLRPGGKRAAASANVAFGDHRFYFSGPFHTVQRARSRGIERKLSRLLASEVKPGSICVDVGAHCGWLSLQMAFATGPEGRVIS
ncbi:MAG: hypothetical protein MI919_29360, partial [Holophagales bacterium]|nr:hypothetical protein [Holophagales bacterium]